MLMVSMIVASFALAAPPPAKPAPAPDRPWAEGVSKEDQTKAEALFTEGTDLLTNAFFTRAVELYRQALTHWDHPAIHFNLAKALMNLDQPAQAYVHLQACMKFGGRPLDADQLEQVERFTKLLYETELAVLVITLDEPGARVTLDGTELFIGPGRWEGVVQPEKTRTILATKTGYQTEQIEPVLIKGQVNEILITLTELASVTTYVTKFDKWIPWAVIGGGVALLGGGGLMTWQSDAAYKDYDTAVATCNANTPYTFVNDAGETVTRPGSIGTCIPTSDITDKKDQGDLFQTLSLVGYIAGGVTVATGIVLLIINRETPVITEEVQTDPTISIVPILGPEHAGVSATIGF